MHWTNQAAPQATLTHGLGTTGDQLGFSVALSGNGSTIVAGAPSSDAARTCTFLGEAWVFQQPPEGCVDNNNPNAVLLAPNCAGQRLLRAGGRDLRRRQDDRRRSDRRRSRPRRGVRVHLADRELDRRSAASATLTSSDGQQEGVGRRLQPTAGSSWRARSRSRSAATWDRGPRTCSSSRPVAGRARPRRRSWSPAMAKAGDGLGQTVAISNGTVIASAPGTDAPGHQNVGSIYAFGSFPSTAISIAPAAPSGSNGWYVHPVSLAVSASDLDHDRHRDPLRARPRRCADRLRCTAGGVRVPGARSRGRRQRLARPVRGGRERRRLRGRAGQSVVQDRHGRPRREVLAHAQLHVSRAEVAWSRRESPTRPRGRRRRLSPSGPMSRARGRRA